MTDAEISVVLNKIRAICTVASCLDPAELEAFITQTTREETLMPFLDPTLFIQTREAGNLRYARDVAQALLALQRVLVKEQPEAERAPWHLSEPAPLRAP